MNDKKLKEYGINLIGNEMKDISIPQKKCFAIINEYEQFKYEY